MKNDDDNIGNDNGLYIKLYDEMDNMKKKNFSQTHIIISNINRYKVCM